MKNNNNPILKGASWITIGFGSGQLLRFVTNIVLARLLTPEIFGVMVIVNSLMMGAEQLSDVGISQSIVQNKDGEKPEFYNTAWTMQFSRGVFLFLIVLFAAKPISIYFQDSQISAVLALSAFGLALRGFASTAVPIVQRRMEFARRTVFEVGNAVVSAILHISFALLSPTVWALVWAGLTSALIRVLITHILLKDISNKIQFSRKYFVEIFKFGKWIFWASFIYFLSMQFDRLYFGTEIPLALLGVYGVARAFSNLFGVFAIRVNNYLVFPLVSSYGRDARDGVRKKLARIRQFYILLTAIVMAFFVVVSDSIVGFLYDDRYGDAGWMMSVMLIAVWFSIISSMNGTMLMGLGRPKYSTLGNISKFTCLVIALPIGFSLCGITGAIIGIVISELVRIAPIYYGQRKEGLSFFSQDLGCTMIFATTIILGEVLRLGLNLGTSFDGAFSSL